MGYQCRECNEVFDEPYSYENPTGNVSYVSGERFEEIKHVEYCPYCRSKEFEPAYPCRRCGALTSDSENLCAECRLAVRLWLEPIVATESEIGKRKDILEYINLESGDWADELISEIKAKELG